MTPAQIQIFASIITILGSGVIAALVNHMFIKEREDKAAKRKRGEELFMAIDAYVKRLKKLHFQYFLCASGKITYEKANSNIVAIRDVASPDHFGTIEMMVSLYYPQLSDMWQEMDKTFTKLGDLQMQFMAQNGNPSNPLSFIDALRGAIDELNESEQEFKKKLTELINSL